MSAEPVLSVEGLGVRFRGQPADLIDGVSFAIPAGRTLCLAGESGCGKSTLARLLLRLIEPSEGVVRYAGQGLTALPAAAQPGAGRRHPLARQSAPGLPLPHPLPPCC